MNEINNNKFKTQKKIMENLRRKSTRADISREVRGWTWLILTAVTIFSVLGVAGKALEGFGMMNLGGKKPEVKKENDGFEDPT